MSPLAEVGGERKPQQSATRKSMVKLTTAIWSGMLDKSTQHQVSDFHGKLTEMHTLTFLLHHL